MALSDAGAAVFSSLSLLLARLRASTRSNLRLGGWDNKGSAGTGARAHAVVQEPGSYPWQWTPAMHRSSMMVASEVSLPGDSAAADAGAGQGGTEGLDSIDRSASAAALAIANSASVALPVSTPVLQRLGDLWLNSTFAGQGAGAGVATRPEFPLGVFGPAS